MTLKKKKTPPMYIHNGGMKSFGLAKLPRCNYFSNQQISLMDAQLVFNPQAFVVASTGPAKLTMYLHYLFIF